MFADGSFLACIYPSDRARRRDEDSITVRVIEYALDMPGEPGRERYRLITSLVDPDAFPATLLAGAYHERWEVETTLDEVPDEVPDEVCDEPRPLRSKHPREVVQELYGLLIAHVAIRTLMHKAAVRQRLDPDRLSFSGALRILRRAIPRAQRTSPRATPPLPADCSTTSLTTDSHPVVPAPTPARSSA